MLQEKFEELTFAKGLVGLKTYGKSPRTSMEYERCVGTVLFLIKLKTSTFMGFQMQAGWL